MTLATYLLVWTVEIKTGLPVRTSQKEERTLAIRKLRAHIAALIGTSSNSFVVHESLLKESGCPRGVLDRTSDPQGRVQELDRGAGMHGAVTFSLCAFCVSLFVMCGAWHALSVGRGFLPRSPNLQFAVCIERLCLPSLAASRMQVARSNTP